MLCVAAAVDLIGDVGVAGKLCRFFVCSALGVCFPGRFCELWRLSQGSALRLHVHVCGKEFLEWLSWY